MQLLRPGAVNGRILDSAESTPANKGSLLESTAIMVTA